MGQANTNGKPSSDLKIPLYDKQSLKKALYCGLMKRLMTPDKPAPICLLEVKLADDVFTVTLALLGESSESEDILIMAMKEALFHSLAHNMKFKLA